MPLIETPIDSVAKTYAHSLFELAQQHGGQGAIENCLGELEEIIDLARGDAALGELLCSRIVDPGKRAASLRRIFEGRCTPMVLNFLLVLNRAGRLRNLTGIVAAFDKLVQNAFGRVEVDVYTAAPLEPGDREALAARLREALGRDPVLHAYVDATMLGGLRVQIGDQLIDASLSSRLRRFGDQIATRGAASVRAAAGRIIAGEASDNGR